jgi:UDP-N-acetylglucosamine diphosphorylase/glucosamine-1-phosphate N-acetyltransferase
MRLRNPGTTVNEISGTSCLFVNGRALASKDFAKDLPLEGSTDTVYMNGDHVIAARISGSKLQQLKGRLTDVLSTADFDGVITKEVDVKLVNYPWDLVNNNGEQLRADCSVLTKKGRSRSVNGKVARGVSLLNKKDIFVGEGSVIKPGVVIDAEEGPVYIGRNVTVLPQSTIIGPAYIGDGSIIKVGAKIYEDTSIGPVCKVGGEVEASIIHGYSNKQHDGFLGHSYVGAWVNLGAGTSNSDLKNNYGSVKVFINGEQVDSGSQFVGLTIGDHSKSSINSTFNTGTVVGVSSNIFGSGFPAKYVPSFSWGAAGETLTTYNIDRAIDVAKRVMARRKVAFSGAEDILFRRVFDLTSEERRMPVAPVRNH